MTPPPAPFPLEPVRADFRAIVMACVPAATGLEADAWREAEAVVARALAERPAAVVRQVVAFHRVLGLLALVRFGRPLRRLEAAKVARLLSALERAPLLLLRRGVWGVRTLAFLGYYGRESVRAQLGYRAAPGGWSAAGGDAGPWADRDGRGAPEAAVRALLGTADSDG